MVAALIGVLVFAVLGSRRRRGSRASTCARTRPESAFVTAALHEALTKLKAQEREMSARAEASERLSSEIVESLSSGLLVVASDGQLRILNPAGRRLLSRDDSALAKPYRRRAARRARAARRGMSEQQGADRAPDAADQLGQISPRRISASAFRRCRMATDEPHGAICLFTDLTPVVEMEEQLRSEGKPCPGRRADGRHRA